MADSIYEAVGWWITIGDVVSGGTNNTILFTDGYGNLADSVDLFWDDTLKIFNAGDTLAALNKTVFTVNDQNSLISNQTDGTFTIRNSTSGILFQTDETARTVKLGDVSSTGNDTLIAVDDINQIIRARTISWGTTFDLFSDAIWGTPWVGFNAFSGTGNVSFSANSTNWNLICNDIGSGNQQVLWVNATSVALSAFNGGTGASASLEASTTNSSIKFTQSFWPQDWLIVNATNLRIGNFSGGNDTLLTIDDANKRINRSINTSTKKAGLWWKIKEYYTSVGNSGTAETDLYTYTTEANLLGTNGDNIEWEYGGVFVSSATATRQVKLYFGWTVIFDTGALTLSLSSARKVDFNIVRVSNTVVRYMISLTTQGAALAAYTATGELTGLTLSSTNILKITGQASGVGAASNDIVAMVGTVIWQPTSI